MVCEELPGLSEACAGVLQTLVVCLATWVQHLEKIGDHAKAVEHYEASGCGPVEVTRMYFQAGMVEELEQYINGQVSMHRVHRTCLTAVIVVVIFVYASNPSTCTGNLFTATTKVTCMLAKCNAHVQGDNKQLTVWWARYCESRGDIKRALACYEKAGDALSIVRIHCYTRNFSAAEEQVGVLRVTGAG
jgi:hypothetical protein